MGISVGSSSLSKVFFGSSEVLKIFLGDVELYSTSGGGGLAAPTLDRFGDMLRITDNSEEAEFFDIYVDGVYAVTVAGATGYEYVELTNGTVKITSAPYEQTGGTVKITNAPGSTYIRPDPAPILIDVPVEQNGGTVKIL